MIRWLSALLLIAIGTSAARAAPPAASEAWFEAKIRPVLAERCYACHSGAAKVLRGGLRLDTRQGWAEGGESGPIIARGKPEESPLLEALSYIPDGPQMPPEGKLPQTSIDDFRAWIAAGAILPESFGASAAEETSNRHPTTGILKHTDYDEGRKFWSLVPPVQPAVPVIADSTWPLGAVDCFVLEQLRRAGIRPNGPADRVALLRRVTYDLVGLPPMPAEIDAFLADSAEDAYARVVERLLASPHYGERWGRRWLDVARYADTAGRGRDDIYASAFCYRDYVVRALNADKPYDRFLTEQLAGDLLPAATLAERNDQLIATTFLNLMPRFVAEPDKTQLKLDLIDEQIDVVSRGLLGLSLSCARCHDHKFDPVSTADYYALAGIFASTRVMENFAAPVSQWREVRLVPPAPEDGELYAMAVADDTPADLPVHLRGSHLNLAPQPTPRGMPHVTDLILPQPDIPAGSSGRLELAQWLVDPHHPLTARVIVNRVWAWHFGQGLVPTCSDFGFRGQAPVNQPLLDYLACEFVRQGWSIKKLHRQIVLSRAYQMSSENTAGSAAADPEDKLLWRFRLQRLDAEQLRDSLLAAGGTLDLTMGGSLLEARQGKLDVFDIPSECFASHRRALYLPISRGEMYPLLSTFDYLDANVSLEARGSSVLPAQTLLLLNNPLVLEQSRAFAARLLECGEPAERVRQAYRTALGRAASAAEVEHALNFVATAGGGDPAAAWAEFCHLLFCSNEFLYIR